MTGEILVDTNRLNQYAQRLDSVISRITALDNRLEALYKQTGSGELLPIIQAGVLFSYAARLRSCRGFLADTASAFEAVENELKTMQIPGYWHTAETDGDITGISPESALSKGLSGAFNSPRAGVGLRQGDYFALEELAGVAVAGAAAGAVLQGEVCVTSDLLIGFNNEISNTGVEGLALRLEDSISGAPALGTPFGLESRVQGDDSPTVSAVKGAAASVIGGERLGKLISTDEDEELTDTYSAFITKELEFLGLDKPFELFPFTGTETDNAKDLGQYLYDLWT